MNLFFSSFTAKYRTASFSEQNVMKVTPDSFWLVRISEEETMIRTTQRRQITLKSLCTEAAILSKAKATSITVNPLYNSMSPREGR